MRRSFRFSPIRAVEECSGSPGDLKRGEVPVCQDTRTHNLHRHFLPPTWMPMTIESHTHTQKHTHLTHIHTHTHTHLTRTPDEQDEQSCASHLHDHRALQAVRHGRRQHLDLCRSCGQRRHFKERRCWADSSVRASACERVHAV